MNDTFVFVSSSWLYFWLKSLVHFFRCWFVFHAARAITFYSFFNGTVSGSLLWACLSTVRTVIAPSVASHVFSTVWAVLGLTSTRDLSNNVIVFSAAARAEGFSTLDSAAAVIWGNDFIRNTLWNHVKWCDINIDLVLVSAEPAAIRTCLFWLNESDVWKVRCRKSFRLAW